MAALQRGFGLAGRHQAERWLEPAAALVAAVIAAAVVLIATAPHGPRVSIDSVFYLSTADTLREGRGLTTFQGTPW